MMLMPQVFKLMHNWNLKYSLEYDYGANNQTINTQYYTVYNKHFKDN